VDTLAVYEIRKTEVFSEWFRHLRDRLAKSRIVARLDSARRGNLGDYKPLGAGLYEMRVHAGPGYRLYYTRRWRAVIVLLCAGDKSSQRRDIEQARRLLLSLDEEGIHAQGEGDQV
jgi:putative addiction module killer protein